MCEIENDIKEIKEKIKNCYDLLNYASDTDIIDSLIYEIKSLNIKYEYYLKLCKNSGYKAESIDMIS